jgi:hypothetical protein
MEHLSVLAVGDVALNGTYRRQDLLRRPPWRRLSILSERVDLRLANLEAPVTSAPRAAASKFALRGAATSVQALRDAGFAALHTANNHMMDFGPAGLRDTLDEIDACRLLQVGAGMDRRSATEPRLLAIDGRRVALLGFCDVVQKSPLYADDAAAGVAPLDARSVAAVRELRSEADWIVVQLHWGAEMCLLPSPEQRVMARELVDAGASAVIGHHPHVLQPCEVVGESPVWYSLGNFCFASEFWRGVNAQGEPFVAEYRLPPVARRGGVARFTLRKGARPEYALSTTRLLPNGEVVPASQDAAWEQWSRRMMGLDSQAYAEQWLRAKEQAEQVRREMSRARTLLQRTRLALYRCGVLSAP